MQFIPAVAGEVVVYNSSDMYGNNGEHIYLYENEEKKNQDHFSDNFDYLLKIRFDRVHGNLPDEPNSIVVDIEGWYNMEIWIKKDYYYNTNDNTPKKVYINGVDITSKADTTFSKEPREGSTLLGPFWYDGNYYFEDFGFIKSNQSDYINTIEVK